MFEDIYKQINQDNGSSKSVSFSTDFQEDYWEEVKKSPEKLGDSIKSIVNFVISTSSISNSHRMVFTDFQFNDELKRLVFNFKFYDTRDEDHNKIYLDSLNPEERKWRGL
jgi:hypothetical protein